RKRFDGAESRFVVHYRRRERGGRFKVKSFSERGFGGLNGPQTMPSRCFASSLIILGFHGGAQTRSTVASTTSSRANIRCLASAAIIVPMPQPGAVSVILTATL